MNRSFIVAVLTVTMIIMMSTAGYAYPAHNFICVDCHGKFAGSPEADNAAVRATNACVGCHSSMSAASRMPVEADAMSNYFGLASGQPSSGSRSSHTWGVYSSNGHPNNKSVASFVLEPTNSALNNGNNGVILNNRTVCVRCHNVKALTNNVQGVDKPLLRATNAGDALCRDCHRLRETSTHTTGSHPINYRIYSTVYKLNTTAFRRVPLSPNVNNPTANPGNYLSSGKIVCSTCHAPHYADSSSATLGNRSTANGFAVDDPAKGLKGTLQNSKGQLLRTDPIGLTPNAINVCSSCHKETKNRNHNAKGQNVQCDHCHGAHVDYTGDASLPNLYLVRRNFSNISISTGKLAAGKKAIYNTATSLRFMRTDGNGICQVCHTPTPGVAIHDRQDTRKGDCLACHKHSNGFSAEACDSCHGQPPVQGKAAPGYTTLDEAFTPHATHADGAYYKYSCKNCHYDGTRADSHNTTPATFQSVFIDTAGSVGDQPGQGLTKNIPSDYNPTARNCANVYCHSNGNPRRPAPATGNVITWKSTLTPSWNNGKNAILGTATECITCHDSDSASGSILNTNAHYAHVKTSNIKCYVCHDATVTSGGAIKDRTKHANGTKDVKFVNQPLNYVGAAFSASFNIGDATCTNSCHTNGLGVSPATPAKWNDSSTGACGTCHDAIPSTSLHTQHFSGQAGPNLGTAPTVCANCHKDPFAAGSNTHANGVIDLRDGNSCSPCHPGTSQIWMTGATVTCESCHTGTLSVVKTYTAPSVDLNSTVGHGRYSSATLPGQTHVKCTSCHNPTAPHIRPAVALKRLTVTGNGLCNTCHISSVMRGMSTARANLLTHSVRINGSGQNVFLTYSTLTDARARDCAGCHDTHGTTNLMSVRTVINGQAIVFNNISTGFYVKTPTNGIYNGLCQVCHTKTNHYRNNADPTLPAFAHYDKNCLDCHTHKGGMFAFQQTKGGGCGGCHGYPPVSNIALYGTFNNYTYAKPETNAGAGGAHTVAGHIPKNAKESDAWVNCSKCHNNTTSTHNVGKLPVKKAFVDVVVDPQFKFNNASTITYKTNSCSNVSCHFKPSPNWTTGL